MPFNYVVQAWPPDEQRAAGITKDSFLKELAARTKLSSRGGGSAKRDSIERADAHNHHIRRVSGNRYGTMQ